MTKERLQEHYNFLTETYEEYLLRERVYKHGKNAKIRKQALSYLEILLTRFENHVMQDIELYKILTNENGTDYSRAITWDEFKSIQYFSIDMSRALRKIEDILTEME